MLCKEEVLTALEQNRGSFISGNALAKKLFASRNAVWKAVKALQAEGYPIRAVTNKGYCLSEETDILSAPGIAKYLREPSRCHIEVREEVTSTNTVCKEFAVAQAPEGTVLLAGTQTAGKGRLGRTFHSPKHSGLYMSLLLRPKLPARDCWYLTAAIAAAAAEAIEELLPCPIDIKWVNDLYLDGKKICGILTEASIDFETQGLEYAVVGIGINIEAPDGGFPEELQDIVGALYPHGQAPNDLRNRLAGEILNRFFAYYDALPEKTFLEPYRTRSCVIGKEIFVIDNIFAPEDARPGTALAIDEDCRLLVRFADGSVEAISSGDVSIRFPHVPNALDAAQS